MDEKELLADAITKAIAYQENGGKLDLEKTSAGKSGEMKSIFQFTPETWKKYSKEVLGKDNVPLDNDHETYVVKQKVRKWIDDGKTTSQIASMWNAGEGKPDAYKENNVGINKYGVKYDTPTYAKNVLNYAKKFYTEKSQQNSNESTVQPNKIAVSPQTTPQPTTGML